MDRRPPDEFDALPPIAGGAQDDLPPAGGADVPPEPLSLEEQVAQAVRLAEEARQRAERAEQDAGHLRAENHELRTRIDSREALGLGYQPAIAPAGGTGPHGPPPQQGESVQDYFTRVLTVGIDDNERSLPTAETVAKIVLNSYPWLDARMQEHLDDQRKRQRMDAAYFDSLADEWSRRTGRAYKANELQARYGERISYISKRILVDPTTNLLLPQFRNNAPLAFQKITEALERELNMAAEDAPAQKPRARLSTGDAGTSRLPTQPGRPSPSQKEMDSLARYATGR